MRFQLAQIGSPDDGEMDALRQLEAFGFFSRRKASDDHPLADVQFPPVASIAVKEAGGITFAEEENSASFFGMPSSAIQTGCVDFILNPLDIAQGLISISLQYRLQKAQNKLRMSDPAC